MKKMIIIFCMLVCTAACTNQFMIENSGGGYFLSELSEQRNENDLRKSVNDKGVILQKNSVIDLERLPKNYTYKLVYGFDHLDELDRIQIVKYVGNENGKYHFVSHYTYHMNGKKVVDEFHFTLNRDATVEYEKWARDPEYRRKNERDCYFLLGKCRFDYGSNSVYTVHNSYKDGVWIQNSVTRYGIKVRKLKVFDEYGLIIYSLNQSHKNAQYTKRVPLEEKDKVIADSLGI